MRNLSKELRRISTDEEWNINDKNFSRRETIFEEAEVRGGNMLWNLPRFFEPS